MEIRPELEIKDEEQKVIVDDMNTMQGMGLI